MHDEGNRHHEEIRGRCEGGRFKNGSVLGAGRQGERYTHTVGTVTE